MTLYAIPGLLRLLWLVEERWLRSLLLQFFMYSVHLDPKPVGDFSPLGFRNLFTAGNAKGQPEIALNGGMCCAGGFVELIHVILHEGLMRLCQRWWPQTLQDSTCDCFQAPYSFLYASTPLVDITPPLEYCGHLPVILNPAIERSIRRGPRWFDDRLGRNQVRW